MINHILYFTLYVRLYIVPFTICHKTKENGIISPMFSKRYIIKINLFVLKMCKFIFGLLLKVAVLILYV